MFRPVPLHVVQLKFSTADVGPYQLCIVADLGQAQTSKLANKQITNKQTL